MDIPLSSSNEPRDSPWWREAFGARYLDLYSHRDETDAARAVAFLRRWVPLTPETRLLDLCCGPGRHLRQLAPEVGWAVGVDLSRYLLDHAAEACRDLLARMNPKRRPTLSLLQADMRRIPLAGDSLDVVVNLFTSFGYFEDDAENAEVIGAVARTLRPGGSFALDHLNARRLMSDLKGDSVRELPNGARVVERRRFDAAASRVVKEALWRGPDGSEAQWSESVRVYDPEELIEMMRVAGFETPRIFGDYDSAPLTPHAPRMILVAKKK